MTVVSKSDVYKFFHALILDFNDLYESAEFKVDKKSERGLLEGAFKALESVSILRSAERPGVGIGLLN